MSKCADLILVRRLHLDRGRPGLACFGSPARRRAACHAISKARSLSLNVSRHSLSFSVRAVSGQRRGASQSTALAIARVVAAVLLVATARLPFGRTASTAACASGEGVAISSKGE